MFDVLVVAHGEKSTKPIVVAGDTVSIRGEYSLLLLVVVVVIPSEELIKKNQLTSLFDVC